MSCQFWCLFFACRHGLNIQIPIPYSHTFKKKTTTIVCIYKATIFAWKILKLHHIIILTIAVLEAIVIKLNIDCWLVIYMMALLCGFRYSNQQHHDQSSSLLHASWKAGFTEDGPWTPCKDKTGWINTPFDGNISHFVSNLIYAVWFFFHVWTSKDRNPCQNVTVFPSSIQLLHTERALEHSFTSMYVTVCSFSEPL